MIHRKMQIIQGPPLQSITFYNNLNRLTSAYNQLANDHMRKKDRPARRPDQGAASLVRAVSHGSVMHAYMTQQAT